MPDPAISYEPRADTTPEAEIAALAAVYKLVLDSKKAAPRQSGPDDPERRSDEIRAKTSIP